ncbi:Accelerated cell death 11 [Dionaea muscipula]
MAEVGGGRPLREIVEAFKGLAATVNSETTAGIEVAVFSRACSLLSPLFTLLGIAFKFAEMDYIAKVVDLEEASKTYLTLESMLEHDIQANTVRNRGSHSRNLLRVKRGIDMVKIMFEEIIATEGNSLKDSASKAYTQVFAPHHGWAIRKAVAAGMYALPTRAQLLMKLNEDEGSAQKQMSDYVSASALVIQYIDRLFLSRELGIDW